MKKALLFLMVFGSLNAHADDLRLGTPAYGGTGCPQGSASAVLSPDQKTLSILFDQYSTQAGYTSRRQVDRKSCNIAIPVHVPNGYSVSLFQVDYRGFNNLPAGGKTRLSVDYFFAGLRGPSYAKDFYGAQNDNYLVSNTLSASAVAWSPCGADVNLRVNSSLMTQTNARNDEAMSTVDSTDIKSGLVYHLQFRRCQ